MATSKKKSTAAKPAAKAETKVTGAKKEAAAEVQEKLVVKAAKAETKKTETKAAKAAKAEAAAVVEEKKAEVKAETPVAEEKKAEVKAEAPVVEEKKAETKAAAKKPAAKKAAKTAEVTTDVFVEFNGAQNACKEVVENVKKTYAAQGNTDEIKTIKVYIKPQENAAYYVVNDTVEGKMDVYF
ncbi:MAG: DUF6465 family protein [Acutalibacteraceae bacterium]|nr:DUF6465 family protein [Acutalibacteraceae bacterium]